MLQLARNFQKLPKKARNGIGAILFGIGGGGIAALFHITVHRIDHAGLRHFAEMNTWSFVLWSFVIVMTGSLIAGFLLGKFCPDAAGSGIPQLKLAFWKEFGYIPWRVVWVKWIAGAISIGAGSSLGREGPSVQLAAGVASNLSGVLGAPKQKRRSAAAAGAAAGLAAAFNTPLAAITFVLEEIVEDLNNSRFLGNILLASVIGAFMVYALIGVNPAFIMPKMEFPDWYVYLLAPIVAAVATLVGAFFQKTTLGLRLACRNVFSPIPVWLRPAVGGLVTWAIGVTVFLNTGSLGVFGLGYEDLTAALNNELPWKLAGILLGAKLIATICCYGFGGCGGIFAPTLFFGAMCGAFLGGGLGYILPMSSTDQIALAVVGMTSCMTAVVRAPITAILMVFEMTHQFSLVPALMLGALVCEGVVYLVSRRNFYEEALLQDGHELEHIMPPRDLRSWRQLPVSVIAKGEAACVTERDPEVLRRLIETKPYERFPLVEDGKYLGVLSRDEIRLALKEERIPIPVEAPQCARNSAIKDIQLKLIESPLGIVIVTDRSIGGKPLGVITLHDLLRAEASLSEKSVDD